MTEETPLADTSNGEAEEKKQKLRWDPWSQHELMASYLREGILVGDFPPGSKLPSTRVMKEMFDAAPQTIKNANDLLAKEGLVVSRRGSGILVRPQPQRTMVPAAYKEPAKPGESYRWIAEAQKQGLRPESEITFVGEVTPSADVRALLGLPEKGIALLRTQVLSLDGEPAELVKTYYPVELARGTALAEPAKIRGGSPRLLADMGYPPLRCVDRVAAWMPTLEHLQALKMPTREPILRTLRATYSTDDRLIEVTVMAKAGYRYELQYEF
ncbi:GntR family transcriptional regulator [Kitasatospora camelliae]|uniref:GntR family transcriptional regulator n=1 Tax=Kitasatospora camelliae TaxID=3156397 RepID=A0AAU8K2N4_9ACTN